MQFSLVDYFYYSVTTALITCGYSYLQLASPLPIVAILHLLSICLCGCSHSCGGGNHTELRPERNHRRKHAL